jgi:hypothetical protein
MLFHTRCSHFVTHTHDTAIMVEVYPDEFKPIMKAIKYALICDDSRKVLNEVEWATVNAWLDYFSDIALNEAV